MLAFGEQGLPYAVDGETLETIGPFTFNGALNEVSPFSAHPSIDRTSGGLVNFGISFSASRPSLNYYRFEADGTLAVRRRVAIPRPSSVHDFALGPRHAVVYLSPDLLDMSVMLSGGSVMDALSWRPENGSVLLILDRESGRQKTLLDVGSGYCLHVVNCFESGGALVLDLLELDEPIYPQYQVMPELFETVGAARPVRYTIDTSTWAVTDKLEIPSELLYDFPVVHPQSEQQPTGSAWMVGITSTGRPGAKFLDRLARVDWDCGSIPDVYQSPEGVAVASEPMIVPHPRHRARAALLCRFIDTRQGTDSVLVFDAYDLAAGPRATLRLPTLTPPSFHGSWIADPPPEDRY